MQVSLDQIKKLRAETNVSIASCNSALEQAQGDYNKALDLLRKKGTMAVAKKADRTLGAGVVRSYIHSNNQVGSMVELLSETDFVSKNEEFSNLAYEIALHSAAMKPRFVKRDNIDKQEYDKLVEELSMSIDQSKSEEIREKILEGKLTDRLSEVVLLEQKYVKNDSMTIGDLLAQATQKFGEKIEIGRISVYAIN